MMIGSLSLHFKHSLKPKVDLSNEHGFKTFLFDMISGSVQNLSLSL